MRALAGRVRSVDGRVVDAALAAALAIGAIVTLAVGTPDPPRLDADPIAYVLAVAATGSVAWRRRYPVTVLVVATACTVALSVAGYVEGPTPFAILIAFYSVASATKRRSRLVGAAILLGAFCVLYAFSERSNFREQDFATNTVLFGAAWVAGEHTRGRRERMAMLEERAAQVVRERDERERRAIADERLRIAQDLHDVVAHAMSVITVQAGVGAHVIDTEPETAKQALAAIESTGRAALHELRLMVGVLRQDGERGGARTPVPSRANIEELVRSYRDAGLPVELRWEGDVAVRMPLSTYPSAYRIIQESLTNVLKHAGTASAVVTVRVSPTSVAIEVVDDGRGAASSLDGHEAGFGLVGMQERATLLGGTLAAGPERGGGYAVRAVLPFAPTGPAEPAGPAGQGMGRSAGAAGPAEPAGPAAGPSEQVVP